MIELVTVTIHAEAELVLKKLQGCLLFGIPLDMEDIRAVALAAYMIGQRDGHRQAVAGYQSIWSESDNQTLK